MWNFGVPYALKYYIDCIVQPGYLFKFDEQGIPRPLLEGKKMIVVSSSGSDYSEGSPTQPFDFFEPYLRTIFGFVGIYDITFIRAHAVDVSPAVREASIARRTDRRGQSWRGRWSLAAPRRRLTSSTRFAATRAASLSASAEGGSTIRAARCRGSVG